MHQYVEPLQTNVPENKIDYNDRIDQRDSDDDVDFEWILSYIKSIVSETSTMQTIS